MELSSRKRIPLFHIIVCFFLPLNPIDPNNIGKLHAVQQALGTKLHLTDNDVAEFVGALLDEVESLKVTDETLTSEQGKAILNDEDVAQAYVENFSLKVFAKADRDVYAKTTTKGTATTFIAAATFLDLLKIFQNPLEKDVADKIRYSKFQATRIIKALKAGEDPNLYDPPEAEKEEEQVDALLEHSTEDAQDNAQPQFDLPSAASHDPSSQPFDLPSAASHDPDAVPFNLPSAASHDPSESTPFDLPSAASHNPGDAPQSPDTVDIPPSSRNVKPSYSPSPPAVQPARSPPRVQAPIQTRAPPSHGHHMTKQEVQSLMDETEVISTAQKHAKFAISALNYEDMSTAIRELTAALDLLKAHAEL